MMGIIVSFPELFAVCSKWLLIFMLNKKFLRMLHNPGDVIQRILCNV